LFSPASDEFHLFLMMASFAPRDPVNWADSAPKRWRALF
jgi:hypothetical protein